MPLGRRSVIRAPLPGPESAVAVLPRALADSLVTARSIPLPVSGAGAGPVPQTVEGVGRLVGRGSWAGVSVGLRRFRAGG